MSAPTPPVTPSPSVTPPSLAARALPYVLLFCAALLVLALIQSRRAAHATDDTKAAQSAGKLVADSLAAQQLVVARALAVRDSLSARVTGLEKSVAASSATTAVTQTNVRTEVAAGEKLVADSLATLAAIRAQLHTTDSISLALVAQVTKERTDAASLHAGDLAVMHADTVAIQALQQEITDAAAQHANDLRQLADALKLQHGWLYRAGTGLLVVGGGGLCGAGGWLLAGPAGLIVGAGACGTAVAVAR